MSLQQRHRLADEVVEVEGVRRAQALLVVRVDPSDDAGEFGGRRIGLRLVGGFFRPDQFVLQVRDLCGQQPGGVLLAVEFEILRDHREQTTGIVGVVDREIRIHALQQTRLRAQDPDAARVEGRDPHRIRARPHQSRHPLAHLGGGLVGERDGEHLTRDDAALGQQIGDATREHRSLAGARARDDQQRGSFVRDRFPLLRIEPFEKSIGSGAGVCERDGSVHRFTKLPDRSDNGSGPHSRSSRVAGPTW